MRSAVFRIVYSFVMFVVVLLFESIVIFCRIRSDEYTSRFV